MSTPVAASDRRAQSSARSNLFTSGLAMGDFLVLERLGLRPVGVVQGFDVVRLKTFKRFHQSAWFLNRGPGYRPGGRDALFTSVYPKLRPGWITYDSRRSAPWQGISPAEMAESTPYDESARRLGRFEINQSLRRTRRHGIEGMGLGGLTTRCVPGLVFELGEVSTTFELAYQRSHDRLRQEAQMLGAHGVIGVVDSVRKLSSSGMTEFHLSGTAVRLDGVEPGDAAVWTTFLSAQHLAKLLEVGLMPVEVVTAFSTLLLVLSSYGKWLRSGQRFRSSDLPELRRLAELSVEVAKRRAYARIGSDSLHGVEVSDNLRDSGDIIFVRDCLIRGTRVRRFTQRQAPADLQIFLELL